ncbi:MAG: hypothetical protein AAGF97_15635, partial [Planctomycetota bacterium]
MKITTIGFTLVLAGVCICFVTFVSLIRGASLDPQTQVPGAVSAKLREPGRHYLWDNHWTVFRGKRWQYPADTPDNAKIVVRDAAGQEVEFVRDTSQNWSIGNNEKTSIGYVEVMEPTLLTLEVDGIGRERIVSVSNRTMQQDLVRRLGGFGVGVVVGLGGLLTLLVGLILRGRGGTG